MSAQDNQPTRAALQTEIARLRQRNATLEQLLADHGVAVPPTEETSPIEPVSSRMSSDSQTAERLHLYEVLVENASDGIGVSDMNGVIAYANKAFKELTGFGDNTVGSLMIDYFDPLDFDQVAKEILPALQESGKYQGQLRYRRPDGTFFIGQISAFMVRDVRDTLIAQAVIVRDITEDVRAEEERAELQLQVINAQQNLLRELSTPLMPIAEGVIVMPVVGEIDAVRAQQIMEALLYGISEQQATTAIIDITGVKVVDAQVASTLLQITKAAQLLGTQAIVSGIGSEMAQTLVMLDSDMDGVMTHRSLRSAIAYALRNP